MVIKDGEVERFYIKNLGLGRNYSNPNFEKGGRTLEIIIFVILVLIVIFGFIVIPMLIAPQTGPNIVDKILYMSRVQ